MTSAASSISETTERITIQAASPGVSGGVQLRGALAAEIDAGVVLADAGYGNDTVSATAKLTHAPIET